MRNFVSVSSQNMAECCNVLTMEKDLFPPNFYKYSWSKVAGAQICPCAVRVSKAKNFVTTCCDLKIVSQLEI